MVRQAADGLANLSRSVSGGSTEDMVRAATRFARRNPTAFLTGAALVGVALGRFATASTHRDHDEPERRRQPGEMGGGGAGYGSPMPGTSASRPPGVSPAVPARPASPSTVSPAAAPASPGYRPGGPGTAGSSLQGDHR